MRVRFVQGTVADGRVVSVGEVCDIPVTDARQLIGLGRCVAIVGAVLDDEQAAPVPRTRDPVATRRRAGGIR